VFTFIVFVDVAKDSPLLPTCFFPFYFLRMYEYVRGIWLCDSGDVQLVLIREGLGCLAVAWGEEGTVLVGHSVKS